ncbi:MAG: hypothetical protein OEZ19_09135, partial [Paracoccaceae bacterium]|nr:hypothetical protein [Paracoccaceae bacterium]
VLGVVIVSTLLNAGYFLPIIYNAFFKPLPAGSNSHGEAPWPMVLAITISAAGTLTLFFLPDVPLGLAQLLIGRSG